MASRNKQHVWTVDSISWRWTHALAGNCHPWVETKQIENVAGDSLYVVSAAEREYWIRGWIRQVAVVTLILWK